MSYSLTHSSFSPLEMASLNSSVQSRTRHRDWVEALQGAARGRGGSMPASVQAQAPLFHTIHARACVYIHIQKISQIK